VVTIKEKEVKEVIPDSSVDSLRLPNTDEDPVALVVPARARVLRAD
jgi:hypothetical protein